MRNIRQQVQVLEELVLLRMLHATVLAETEQWPANDHLTVILNAIDRHNRGAVLPVGPDVPDDLDGRC